MERNGTERSVFFRLFIKIFRFRVRDPEIEVFGFRAGYCTASRRKVRKRTERNSSFRSVPFHSVPGFSNHHDAVQRAANR